MPMIKPPKMPCTLPKPNNDCGKAYAGDYAHRIGDEEKKL